MMIMAEIAVVMFIVSTVFVCRAIWKETCRRWRKALNGNEHLRAENHLLQQLWVTVNLSCTPSDDEDIGVLREYMKACIKKADEYEAFIESARPMEGQGGMSKWQLRQCG